MTNFSRRTFLKGCSAAIAGMAGARLHSAVFAQPGDEPDQEILISIFLRGGADVLNIIPPLGGSDRAAYEAARPELKIPVSEALPLADSGFGLHPAMASLHELFGDGKLALVQATGMHADTRSHFEAMSYMERGTPGDKSVAGGWIARHLQSVPDLPATLLMPALAMCNSSPAAFATHNDVIAMNTTQGFGFSTGFSQWHNAQRAALRHVYSAGSTHARIAGLQALDAADLIELNTRDEYVPLTGVEYPENRFGQHLRTIAQMVKLQVGLRTATVDLGGWDTHDAQGNGANGYFAGLLQTLSDGLSAFYTDLNTSGQNSFSQRVTVVVMSEFGRRLRENADSGTDHGHGGAMLVLGGQVNGGVYGQWPGLHADQLYDNVDLAVTTDYRQVLSELLVRRLGNPNLGVVFPGYRDYAPLGLVTGADLAVNYAESEADTPEPRATAEPAPTAQSTQPEPVTEEEVANSGFGVGATVAGAAVAASAAGLIALRKRGASAETQS